MPEQAKAASRYERATDRAAGNFGSGIVALTSLGVSEWISRWVAWGYMIGFFVLAAGFGVYALGARGASDA